MMSNVTVTRRLLCVNMCLDACVQYYIMHNDDTLAHHNHAYLVHNPHPYLVHLDLDVCASRSTYPRREHDLVRMYSRDRSRRT